MCIQRKNTPILLQERYRKAVDEFVRRAKEQYGDRIEKIMLFSSVAGEEARKDSISICWWSGKGREGSSERIM